jgi:hypothetical protein
MEITGVRLRGSIETTVDTINADNALQVEVGYEATSRAKALTLGIQIGNADCGD